MKALLAVLILCTSAWAQEARFFEIPVDTLPFRASTVSDGGNLVHVFYARGNTVFHLGYDTDAESIAIPAHELQISWAGTAKDIAAVALLTNGNWLCVVTGYSDWLSGSHFVRHHRGWVVQGSNAQQISATEFYFWSEDSDNPDAGYGHLEDVRVVTRPNGGYILTGSKRQTFGSTIGRLLIYPPLFSYVLPYQTWNWGYGFTAFPQVLNDDTLELLTCSTQGISHARIALGSDTSFVTPMRQWDDFNLWLPYLMLTNDGRVLARRNRNTYELTEDSALVLISTLSSGSNCCLDSWTAAYHSNYGLADFYQGLGLMLNRVDTSGVEHFGAGPVGWGVAGFYAGINFVPTNGDILATYFGYPGSPAQIGLAIVPWDAPLDVPIDIEPLPRSFSFSAYPNPFNSSVTIEYELQRAGEIELAVFNTLGQKVETLFAGNRLAGRHSMTWSPNTSSGVYFVKLVSGELQQSQKLLYLR